MSKRRTKPMEGIATPVDPYRLPGKRARAKNQRARKRDKFERVKYRHWNNDPK